MNIGIENIKDFSIPLDADTIQRFFTDEEELTPTDEHKDQILMFSGDASKFLWNFEHNVLGIEANSKFYKTIATYDSNGKSISEIKKYLFNLGIPFNNWIFIAEQPHLGFMMTWKMVIKYSAGLFFDDYQQVWDKTLNWKLEFNHGQFTFGKDLIYNSNIEADKISSSISEMRKKSL